MPRSGKNNERTEQVPRGNRKLNKVEPLHPPAKYLDKRYNDLAKFPEENPYPVMRIHKDGTVLYANKASEPLLKAKDTAVGLPAPPECRRLTEETLTSGRIGELETEHNERIFNMRAVPVVESNYVNFYGTDITEQKMAEEEREITIKLLSLINSNNQIHDLMKLVTALLRDWSGCEAVGIRFQDGEDFPYFETSGFPEEFVLAESKLCSLNELGEPVRDRQGKVYLECMCGNIISGRFDPSKPFFTEHGSFWTNSTTELLASTTNTDRMAKTRNRCNTAGYESVSLVPLRAGKETFGLLQLNSKQRNLFTPEKISLLERLADNLAIGLAQRRAEESLRESENKFKTLADEAFDSIVIHDGQRIIEVNKAFCRLWGYDFKEAVGMKIEKFFAPECWEDAKKRIQSGYDRPYEAGTIRKDGTRFQVEIAGHSIIYKGKPARIATTRDITERKRAEEELLWKTAFLESQVEANLDGVLVVDNNNQKILTNKRLIELFKVPQHIVEDKDDTMFLQYAVSQVKHPEQFLEKIKYLYSHQNETSWDEIEFKNEMVLDRYSSPVVDNNGRYFGRIWTFRDITERKKAEESLLASEVRYRRLFEAARDGILILDADSGLIVDVNPFIENILGYPHKGFLNKHLWEIGFFKDIEASKDAFLELQTKGYVRYENLPLKTKDGRQIAVEFVSNVYMVDHKKVIQCNIRDITERALVEEALQISETKFRELFSHMSSGVAVYEAVDDGSDFIIRDFNTAGQKIDKTSKEDAVGKRATQVFPGVKEMGILDVFRRVWETGNAEYFPTSFYKDGRISEWRENHVYKLPSGEVVAVYDDVTERQVALERLQEERNLLRTLIDHIPDDVYIKDKDSRFIICNNAVAGYWDTQGKSNIIGKTDFDLFEPAEAQRYFDEEQKIMQTGQLIANMERQITDRTGNVHYCLTTKLPLRDSSGIITGIVGFNRNITERKKTEHKLLDYQKQLKRLAAQLALVEERERRRIAGTLHDQVSQSLALAKIKLDTLHAAVSSQPLAQTIEDISGSIEKAIQDTRSLTFDLSNPILYELGFEAAIAEWLTEQVQGKHGITTEFQDDGKPKPLDDDVRAILFRNVRELLINVIKHARAKMVKVNVLRIDDSIEVTVEDNGIGYDLADVRSVSAKTLKFGLFSIRESIEHLGGRFEIESSPGAGCKATMTAPLKGQTF